MSRKEVPRAGLIKAALAGRISNVQGGDGDGPERPSVSASESPVPGGGGPGPGAQSPGAALGAPLAPDVQVRIGELLQTTYAGFNDCHLCETTNASWARDHSVRVGGRTILLPRQPGGRSWAGYRVDVRELLGGDLVVLYHGMPLAIQSWPGPFTLRPRSAPRLSRRAATPTVTVSGAELRQLPAPPAVPPAPPRPRRPSPNHPWHRSASRPTRVPATPR